MTTIKLKNGSGAPTAGDLAQGEPALDLTNKRLYTEDSGGTVIEVGTNPGVDVTFADDRKAIFGAGSDLQIYHNGSNSYIDDAGTGSLVIRSSAVNIGKYTGETAAVFTADGSVQLRYDNSAKFETTATGIDVTGSISADGLTVDGNATINSASPILYLTESDTTNLNTRIRNAAGNYQIHTGNDALNSFTARMNISHSTGDISFYEDTGTTAKLFWDASAESLGIGNSSPTTALDVTGTATMDGLTVDGDGSFTGDITINRSGVLTRGIEWNRSGTIDAAIKLHDDEIVKFDNFFNNGYQFRAGASGSEQLKLKIDSDGDISFYDTSGTSQSLFWDASTERLGIGTTSPAATLHLKGAGGCELHMESGDGNSTSVIKHNQSTDALEFYPDGSLAMTLQAGNQAIFESNVGIGTTAPERTLHVDSAGVQIGALISSTSAVAARLSLMDANTTNSASVGIGATGDNLGLYAGGAARATLDSSGNLLVSKSSLDVGTVGLELRADGLLAATRSASNVAVFRRLSDDGSIVDFQKDTDTVGSINSWDQSGTSRVGFVNNDSNGLGIYRSNSTSVKIVPLKTGALDDGTAVDLGNSTARFKDLYLSGGVYLGGTDSANLLDDYEHGSWTPTADFSTTSPTSGATTGTGRYVKVGNLVTVWGTLTNFNVAGAAGDLNITGLPFTARLATNLQRYVGTARYSTIDVSGLNNPISIVCQVLDNSTVLTLQVMRDGIASDNIDTAELTDGATDVSITITYETDA